MKIRGLQPSSQLETVNLTSELWVQASMLTSMLDESTRAHSDRVARYAAAIAENLFLGSGEQEKTNTINVLYIAGLLHDLGKARIDKSILLKNGPLSKSEWELVKQHPLYGFRELEARGFPRDITRLVLYHHESYGGRGYPEGLVGEQIPIGARILTVADSFDAMTSPRPYQSAMSKNAAVGELLKLSPQQFDPILTRAFADSMNIPRASTVVQDDAVIDINRTTRRMLSVCGEFMKSIFEVYRRPAEYRTLSDSGGAL